MEPCIFCKIRDQEIASEFLYSDENVMVVNDIHPKKPVHLLIIPKEHVREFVAITDITLFEKLGRVVQHMIREYNLQDKGYKIEVNGGGLQEVDHLHIHLMGPMGTPSKS